MKKALYVSEKVFYILMIHLVTFALRPMTWTVLSGQLLNVNPVSIGQCLSNLLLFLVTVFLIACFFKGRNGMLLFSEFLGLFFKKCLWEILVLRLITDILHFLIQLRPSVIGESAALVLEAASLTIVFLILQKHLYSQKPKMSAICRYGIIGGAALLAGLAVFYACRFARYSEVVEQAYQKYADPSFLTQTSTADFILQLVALLFSFVLWITLFLSFGFFNSASLKTYKWSTLTARILCTIMGAFIFAGVKAIVLPYGVLGTFDNQKVEAVSYSEPQIQDEYSVMTVHRRLGYTYEEAVFKTAEIKILYGNTPLLNFYATSNSSDGRLQPVEGTFTQEAYRYEFDAVAYVNNDVPFAIAFKDINDYGEQDECLIAICEKLIEEDHFEALEYSYEYLLTYDPAFLISYMEETGEVDSDYCHRNSHINREYMETVWKTIVAEIS